MIDFHTHLLPNVDDGSKSIEETKLLLDELSRQGVGTAVLTPHFYPLADTVKKFLERRNKAITELLTVYDKKLHPLLFVGAEVAYFHGISKADELRQLCVEGTDIFLLELPFCKWDDGVVQEVLDIADNLQVKVVLAHINRYLPHKNAKYLDILQKNGIILQANAEWFLEKKTLKKDIKYIKQEKIGCLGSDAHNTLTRPPRIREAVDNIAIKIGDKPLNRIFEFSKNLLKKAKSL